MPKEKREEKKVKETIPCQVCHQYQAWQPIWEISCVCPHSQEEKVLFQMFSRDVQKHARMSRALSDCSPHGDSSSWGSFSWACRTGNHSPSSDAPPLTVGSPQEGLCRTKSAAFFCWRSSSSSIVGDPQPIQRWGAPVSSDNPVCLGWLRGTTCIPAGPLGSQGLKLW